MYKIILLIVFFIFNLKIALASDELLSNDEFIYIKKEVLDKLTNSSEDGYQSNYLSWDRSNSNNSNLRYSSLNQININNINKLKLAWEFNFNDGFDTIQSNPIFYDGILISPTTGKNLVGINVETGKELWKLNLGKFTPAKRGLTLGPIVNNTRNIYFTHNNKIYSVNYKNGKLNKSFGNEGTVNINQFPSIRKKIYFTSIFDIFRPSFYIYNFKKFFNEFNAQSFVAPIIYKDTIVIGVMSGKVNAYDLDSGKFKWTFNLRKNNDFFEGANPWGGIASDNKRGIVYISVGNPKPSRLGDKRTGRNKYSNSLVALNIENGKLLWDFQETRHDLWNLDIASPPNLINIKINDKNIDVVVVATKLGNTLILDRLTGKPIFDFRLKKVINSTNSNNWNFQPSLTIPEPFTRQVFKYDDISNISNDSYEYVSKIVQKSNYGFFQDFEINKPTIFYGIHGGAQWTGASIDPRDSSLYITSNQIAWVQSVNSLDTNASNKVFYKFKIFLKYIYNYFFGDFINPFLNESKWQRLLDHNGYPGSKPPWGELIKMNLNTGKIVWRTPLGEHEELSTIGVPPTGTENFGGATVTGGDLVFASGTTDNKIRAFNSQTGKELWQYELPFRGSTSPTVFEHNNKQYLIITATGGGKLKSKLGDSILAFKLD